MIDVLLIGESNYIDNLDQFIDWKQYSCNITKAYNGLEAWELCQQIHPHLVITDIPIPALSGIELTEKIIQMDSSIKVIFLTDYDDFSYSRTAIQLNVYDYILKRETDKGKFTVIIRDVCNHIMKKTEGEKILCKEIIRSAFVEKYSNMRLDLLMEYFPDKYIFFAIEQDVYPAVLFNLSGKVCVGIDENRMEQILYDCFDDLHEMVKVTPHRYLGLIRRRNGVKFDAGKLKNLISARLHKSVSVFLLGENKGIIECKSIYDKATPLFEERYFLGESITCNYLYYHSSNKKTCHFKLSRIENEVKKGNVDDAIELINEIYGSLMESHDMRQFELITNDLLMLLQSLEFKLIDYKNKRVFELYGGDDEASWYGAANFIRWIKAKYIDAITILASNSEYRYSEVIQHAIYFMYCNYKNSELSIQDISIEVSLGANRLNAVFKQETGYTVGRYLTAIRMHNAEEILQTKRYGLSKVFEEIGYKTNNYFLSVFKKTYGITPSEYIKSLN